MRKHEDAGKRKNAGPLLVYRGIIWCVMGKKTTEKPPKKRVLDDVSHKTQRIIGAVALFIAALFLLLSGLGLAGILGGYVYSGVSYIFGYWFYALPLALIIVAVALLKAEEGQAALQTIKIIGAAILGVVLLGLSHVVMPNSAGLIGSGIASPLVALMEVYATVVVLIGFAIVSILILFDSRLDLGILRFFNQLFAKKGEGDELLALPEASASEYVTVAVSDDSPPPETASESGGAAIASMMGFGGKPASEPAAPPVPIHFGPYSPPPLTLLERDKGKPDVGDTKANSNIIKRTLLQFGIKVEMDEIVVGPTVTRYALKPAEGVRLSKILSLQSNLELALAAHPIRIEAPIPGKSLVGIEVPNVSKSTVGLASLLSGPAFADGAKPLLTALGKEITGAAVLADIAKMPHALIAGTTGSGKSVTIHGIILSLLFRNGPERLRLILVDPKRVELTLYNNIPHLYGTPVITDARKAIMALKWASKEMDRRYDILQENSVQNISEYHNDIFAPAAAKKDKNPDLELPDPMPHIVIVIDELAEIMQTYPREMEACVVRLAQLSRAVGIHLILATQRPSVNVITGLIKANIPTRIALQVASLVDSRTILDMPGAEKLLGKGDMLYLSADSAKPKRLQSANSTGEEVKKVVRYLIDHSNFDIQSGIDFGAMESSGTTFAGDVGGGDGDDDELYEEARMAVIQAGKASTSLLQRKFRVGYGRAARLIDMLEERGVVGPADGSKPRDVLIKGGSAVDDQ